MEQGKDIGYLDVGEMHIKSVSEALQGLRVEGEVGLSEEEVKKRREIYGENSLEKEKGISLLTLVIQQFDDLLVKILLVAACISLMLAWFGGDFAKEGAAAFVEPLVILIILILNACVGVWQECNAEKALAALKSLQAESALVCRGGIWRMLASSELVPGDIVEVRVGDKIPADSRILKIKTSALRILQSQLTGESYSVSKSEDALSADERDVELQGKSNILFASTIVVHGHALACVYATGMRTVIGSIQSAVKTAAEAEEETPLQKKLDEFGKILSQVIFAICILVWLINWKNFFDPVHGGGIRGCIYYFKIAVALAVAAIPEGLPAVITTCLALGTKKMAKKNAVVRKLQSVETLGCTTVICSDKTGTLTTNQMTCVKFSLPKNAEELNVYEVEGCDYTPVGLITGVYDKQLLNPIGEDDICLQEFARCGCLCNEARISVQNEKFVIQGEPTEAAIKVMVEKLGCPDEALNAKFLRKAQRGNTHSPFCNYWSKGMSHLATLEFTRDRKSMSVLYRNQQNNQNVLFVKGAPESILERCSSVMLPNGEVERLTPEMAKTIISEVNSMAKEALRTLSLASKFDPPELREFSGKEKNTHAFQLLSDPDNFYKLEDDMTFLGLVGLLDPPRPEVQGAIQLCCQAGINVFIITGDNKLTAEAIACKIGVIDDQQNLKGRSFTGKEFEALSIQKKHKLLSGDGGLVFSRTEPVHKQSIIKILREIGEVTAMTGDGVNDAPALKQADIGVAMGITGTEVAKESADMVLADDNFTTIVAAVKEGRSIFNNMKAFIRYLISSNIGEVASIFVTAALGVPEGLVPVQLLWVNLVTDGPPATALGFNPPDVDVMNKPPRDRNNPLISGWIFFRYLVIGIYVGIATVGIFVWWYVYGLDPTDGHTLISFNELRNYHSCKNWKEFTVNTVYDMHPDDPCTYFTAGKIKASTLSLTVLVVIEMLNAFNALSEDGSLFYMPPWSNPWLVLAVFSSIGVHCCILYIPFLRRLFGVIPLSLHDWTWVLIWSFPVIIIDELLKFIARVTNAYSLQRRGAKVAPIKSE